MDQFTADIAGMLELFAIAAGLVLLHRAGKEAPAKLLKAAGWVLRNKGRHGPMCPCPFHPFMVHLAPSPRGGGITPCGIEPIPGAVMPGPIIVHLDGEVPHQTLNIIPVPHFSPGVAK